MKALGLRLVNWCGKQEETGVETMKHAKAKIVESKALVRTITWLSVGAAAVATGYFVGRQLRARYLLNHRTPYDFYSHAGDKGNGAEFGVGI